MTDIRARIMPSGPTPSKAEWTDHFWYHFITTAAQANEACSDEDADALVAVVQHYYVTLPCVHCKTHCAAYVKAHPFTTRHAHNLDAAIGWVLDFREAIAVRVRAEAEAASAAAGAPVPEPKRLRRSCIPTTAGCVFDEKAEAAALREAAAELILKIKKWRVDHEDCGCNALTYNWTSVLKPVGACARTRKGPSPIVPRGAAPAV